MADKQRTRPKHDLKFETKSFWPNRPLSQEKPISILKITFGNPHVGIWGAIALFFNRDHFQLLKISCVVGTSERLFQINPARPWREFEQKIFDQLVRRDRNLRATNELKSRLGDEINYHRFEEFCAILKTRDSKRLEAYLTSFLEKLYLVGVLRVLFFVEEISLDEFESQAPADSAALEQDEIEAEGSLARASDPLTSGARPILSPVFGTLVSDLEPGDKIWVRLNNPTLQDRKSLTEEAMVRSITHDDTTGFTIYAALANEEIVGFVETENIRFRCDKPERKGPLARAFGFFINPWVLIVLVTLGFLIFLINIST